MPGVAVPGRVGGSPLAVRARSRVARRRRTFTDVTQPAGLAAVGDLVGLVDVRENTLSVYDAGTFAKLAELPAGAGPTHVVADRRGRLAVIDTRGGAVLLYELGPQPRQIGTLELPGSPYGVAYDPVRDRLWVTLTARNELVGLDLGASPPAEAVRLPTVRQPNTVAVDSVTGRVFVTGTAEATVELIDPPA